MNSTVGSASFPRSIEHAPAAPRLQVRLGSLVGLLVAVYYARHLALRLADPDLWGRLAVGEWFLAWGAMPRNDPFSYTPQLPQWIDHEWLTGVVFYVLQVVGGDAAILVAKTALACSALAGALATARLHGPLRITHWLLAVVAMPLFGYGALPRAQLFTFALFAWWLFLLEQHRLRGAAIGLTLLPLSMLAWANLHGGFLAGLGLAAMYAVATATKPRTCAPIVLAGAAATAASLVNPYGLDYWRYLLDAVSMHRPGIHEWSPVPLRLGYGHFWLVALLTVGTLWSEHRRWREQPVVYLALLVTLVLATRHARHMPLMATVVCAFVPGLLATSERVARYAILRAHESLAGGGLVAAVLAVTLWQGYALAAGDGPWSLDLPENPTIENMVDFPVGAVAYIEREGLRGNVAVPFNWGEYVLWRLYPVCRVSIDGRYETVYPRETTEMVERFFLAEESWRALIDEHPTNLVLAPSIAPVNDRLAADRQWRCLYRDAVALVWARDVGQASP